MIAILDAHRAGLLRRQHWFPNILAGAIVGVVALPLSMAFAIASGVDPAQGIYTAIIAGIIVSLFGGSRVQIAGPTGAFIVVLAGIVREHGVRGLQTATIMAGIILVIMGIARLGAIIQFIPAPVIAGFTAGIGVIIWVGQWDAFFGLPKPEGEHFHEKLWDLLRSFDQLDLATTALACIGLAILIGTPRIPKVNRIPAPLLAMVTVTALQAAIGFDGVTTIGSAFGGIPSGLPSFVSPDVSPDTIVDLLGPAFTIAMLGAIESLLSAVVADGMTNGRHDSNQELIGQGIANTGSALFGGIAATGAIARTATNIRNGGTNGIAGVTHSLVLVAILIAMAPLAAEIPLAALAAILFVVAYNMSDVRHVIRMIRRAPLADVVILLATFGLTVFSDLVIAVNVGVLLATLQFLRRMASSVAVEQMTGSDIAYERAQNGNNGNRALPVEVPPGVMVYAITGPIFFAAVDAFEQAIVHTHTNPEILIIRLGRVPFMDISGLHVLEEVTDDLKAHGTKVVLCDANPRVKAKLVRAGLVDGIGGGGSYYATLAEALDHIEEIRRKNGSGEGGAG
jgi:SulP family sulfate permease